MKQMFEGIIQIIIGIIGLIIIGIIGLKVIAGVGGWFVDLYDNESSNSTIATSTNTIEKNQETNSTMNQTIKQATTAVEMQNQGEVMYDSYEYYRTTKKGIKVYKIKYTTSYEDSYYYQLVSFNDDYTGIEHSTKLFNFHYASWRGEEIGPTQEMEYAYKTTFEDYYEELEDIYK